MEEIFARLECFPSQFLKELKAAYSACVRVQNISSWFNRLDQLTSALKRGGATYRQVEDHVFELKIINYMSKSFPICEIIYEPKGVFQGGKNCDLEINYQSKRYLVEVKCFHPEWKKAKIPKKYIPNNNIVIMNGTSYHRYKAARGHLLDITYDTEQKFENYDGAFISVLAVPDRFPLNIEDLRDFVFIYRKGHSRPDDPLGPMTLYNLRAPSKGNIDQFWAFPFPQESFVLKTDKEAKVVAPFKKIDKNVEL